MSYLSSGSSTSPQERYKDLYGGKEIGFLIFLIKNKRLPLEIRWHIANRIFRQIDLSNCNMDATALCSFVDYLNDNERNKIARMIYSKRPDMGQALVVLRCADRKCGKLMAKRTITRWSHLAFTGAPKEKGSLRQLLQYIVEMTDADGITKSAAKDILAKTLSGMTATPVRKMRGLSKKKQQRQNWEVSLLSRGGGK